jgi:S-formylglutathione hydrolase FrmB
MKIAALSLACLLACGSKEPVPAPAPAPAPVAALPSQGHSGVAPAASGIVEERTFHSQALDVDKTYVVYLPIDYATNPDKKWPVFYYLHGLTGDEHTWVKGGEINKVADQLHLDAILVMPDGDDGFYADSDKPVDYDACMKDGTGLFAPQMKNPKKTCVKHSRYETYIVKDLLADVDAHYRTNATGAARGIAGMSMGGLGAWELAMRHPDLFAAAASHSGFLGLTYKGPHPYVAGHPKDVTFSDAPRPGSSGNDLVDWVIGIYGHDKANWVAHDPELLIAKLEPGKPALYLDCGTEDEFHFFDQAAYIHDLLIARHIDHAYFLGPGNHSFAFWAPREVDSLRWLQQHVAKP